jgi:hypothetical protein
VQDTISRKTTVISSVFNCPEIQLTRGYILPDTPPVLYQIFTAAHWYRSFATARASCVQILAGTGLKTPFCTTAVHQIFAPAYFQTF